MAHRIYIYNVDSATDQEFSTYLGEWNYEIPLLLLPLFSGKVTRKKDLLYFNLAEGISGLHTFYELLEKEYVLLENTNYRNAKSTMFGFLENLPYNILLADATDVFNMDDEKHSTQAKEWIAEIAEKYVHYEEAYKMQSLESFQELLRETYGSLTWLELLETDWINYGLGYWNEDAFREDLIEVYEENGKQGLKSQKGELLTAAIYDEIYVVSDLPYVTAQKDGSYGYLNKDGSIAVPFIYQDVDTVMQLERERDDPKAPSDVFYAGIVRENNKFGLLEIATQRMLLPPVYELIEPLFSVYFNVLEEGGWRIVNIENRDVVPEFSEKPYQTDYEYLFYRKNKGTAKCSFFTSSGHYIGDYLEDKVGQINNGYFLIEKNKFQPKIAIVGPDGGKLIADVDQFVGYSSNRSSFTGYQAFAVKQEKQWKLYDTRNHIFRLADLKIDNILIHDYTYDQPNTFIVQSDVQLGYYHVLEDRWCIPLSSDVKKIESCSPGFFRIVLPNGLMQYYDMESKTRSETYDYVHASPTNGLCVYKDNKIYRLDTSGTVKELSLQEIGRMSEESLYTLQQRDQSYFLQFYRDLENKLGDTLLSSLDDNTLLDKAIRKQDKGDTEGAIKIYRVLADRGNQYASFDLGSIYLGREDYENAIPYLEEAAAKNNCYAWNNIGALYQKGLGYAQDVEKAIFCYGKAGELGDGLGFVNLGNLYFYGELVEQDYDQALVYYKKAEKLKEFQWNNVAEIYYQQGNYPELLKVLKKDRNHEFSEIYYGIMYDHGYGVAQDSAKAIKYYRQGLQYRLYDYAFERLLYYYGEHSDWINKTEYVYWTQWGKDNGMME